MIPLCLVAGFLGSGKTTFLRKAWERHRALRPALVVNDFASVDIDGQLLSLEPGDVIAVPGGSIFCRCLVTEFIRVLRAISDRPDPPGGVLVEASGIADPRVLPTMLREAGLDGVFDLRSIVTVVDPGSLLKLLRTLPNIRAQIQSADHVLVNKTDLFAERDIVRAEAAVLEIAPSARIHRASFGDADLDVFATPPSMQRPGGSYAACRDPHYASLTVRWTGAGDPERLRQELAQGGDSVYRAKGFFPTPQGLLYVDASLAGVDMRPSAVQPADPCMIFIVDGKRLEEFASRLAAMPCAELVT